LREYREHRIEVGYEKSSVRIYDELEQVVAKFIRAGWSVETTTIDDTLEFIDIIFYREIVLD
jgi:hypothetical protein